MHSIDRIKRIDQSDKHTENTQDYNKVSKIKFFFSSKGHLPTASFDGFLYE
ncbi:hypothetical protein VEA_003592 [Vibrio antiquarius]|uniref:Uncharacterized protein n=1 Tax=Vibrio antiquarius (strain Ex25) TaxID=150340 RepID=A0ACA6QMR7_VIBAE|nr:hypothetical protein VEA_003592 [Vibrio antiquarius]